MPAQYEAIKKSELKSGKSKKESERIAAATYNKNRPKGATPMGPNYEARAKKNVKGSNDDMHNGPVKGTGKNPPANPKSTNQSPHQKESGYNLRGAAHSSHMRKKVKDGLAAAFPKKCPDCGNNMSDCTCGDGKEGY